MAKKLVEDGYAIDLDAIRADVGDGVWGRPHLARALIRAGYAANNDEAFDRFLGREHPWYVPYEKWKAADVVRAIRAAGGVSSLAHAVWYKNTDALIRASPPKASTRSRSSIPITGRRGAAPRRSRRASSRSPSTAGSDFHGTPEGRKRPGGVFGDAAMLEALRARRRAEPRLQSDISIEVEDRPAAAAERSDIICPTVRALPWRCGKPRRCGKEIFSPAAARVGRMCMRKSRSLLTAAERREESPTTPRCSKKPPPKRVCRRTSKRSARCSARSCSTRPRSPSSFPILSTGRLLPRHAPAHLPVDAGALPAVGRDRRPHAARRSSTAAGAVEKAGGAAYLSSLLDGVPDVATSSTTPGSSRKSRRCAG